MWIVVVVDTYYPSVITFEIEHEARKFYVDNKEQYGNIVHLAEVKDTHIGEDCPYDKNNSVDWAHLTD